MNAFKLILFSFFFTQPFFAQKNYKFFNYSTNEGLTSNTIYDIDELNSGELVLGTDNGLSIYNGQRFKTYNTKEGLLNPYICCLKTDKQGRIWLANYGKEYQCFKNGKFITLPIQANGAYKIQLFGDSIIFLNKNTTKNKITNETNYSFSETLAHRYQLIKKNKYKRNNFRSFTISDKRVIFTANKALIDFYDNGKKRLVFYKNGIEISTNQKKQFILYPFKKTVLIHDFIIDKKDQIWISVHGYGCFVYKDEKWINVSKIIGLLPTDNVNKIFCSKDNTIWIGTHEHGLFKLNSFNNFTYHFENYSNHIIDICNFNNNLYVSTRDEILKLKNNQFELFQNQYESHFSLVKDTLTIGSNSILKNKRNGFINFITAKFIAPFSENKIIYSQDGYEIKIVDYETNKSTILDKGELFSQDRIQKIQVIDSSVFINYYSNIAHYKLIKNKLVFIKTIDLQNIKNRFISDFIFNKEELYIAINDVVYFFKNQKLCAKFNSVNNLEIGYTTKFFFIGGDIWLISTKGLFKITGHKMVYNYYNYLENAEITTVTKHKNQLFVGTKKGLTVIDLSKPIYTENSFFFKTPNKKYILTNSTKTVKIDLDIINFNSKQNLIINYQLNDSKWIKTTDETIYLSNLSYGNHVLKIRIRDVNSNWQIKKVLIERIKPFYLSNWFIIISTLFSTLVIIGIIQLRIKKNKKREREKELLTIQITELRQNALISMLNPHFIFNSLNSLQYFVNSNEIKKSSDHIAQFSKLMRYFLYHADKKTIQLSEELKRIELYCFLEQVRFNNNFQFTFTIDPTIENLETIEIPNMILQPFIENAIIHGVSSITENGLINVRIEKINETILQIKIEDNGLGLQLKNESEHISKAKSIIIERFKLMQEYNPQATYTIEFDDIHPLSTQKGHRVTLKFSINSQEIKV